MTIPRALHGGMVGGSQRKPRRRAVPRWLLKSQAVDAVARSRCLMVMSVLSGEVPVTEAVVQAKVSRATYYQLETRALMGMLSALNPRGPGGKRRTPDAMVSGRIEALEAKVTRLEQEKRRVERLLMLTRKTLGAPRLPGCRGRPPKDLSSTPRPQWRSLSSTAKAALDALSTPTTDGAGGS